MKDKFLLLLFLWLCNTSNSFSQNCAGGRYSAVVFPEVSSDLNVEYGRNKLQDGITEMILEMDIYYPQNDTETNRPLILLAHGGAFVQGSRQDMSFMCETLAKMGYVVATYSYRLLDLDMNVLLNPGAEFKKEVVRSLHDTKAAIRFFRKSHAEGNVYGINPNQIIIGGVSAGAILANHAAYMDTDNKIPNDLVSYVNSQGGLEGNSGNPGYSSKPQLVVSLCGAIMDTTWLENGAQPHISIHNTGDNVVPNLYGQPNIGVVIPIYLYGDSLIHKRALNQNVNTKYMRIDSEGHCVFPEHSIQFIVDFIAEQICNYNLSVDEKVKQFDFSVYPNPTSNRFYIDMLNLGNRVNYELLDLSGKMILNGEIDDSQYRTEISTNDLKSGIYIVKIGTDSGNFSTKKIVVK